MLSIAQVLAKEFSMLRFACADFTFPVLERSAALNLVKLLGFEYVDIGLFARSTHFSPIELQASANRYTAQVVRDLDDAELRPSDVFVQLGVDPSERAANDPSSDMRITNREIFSHALEFCVAIGCVHLTGLPGVFHPATCRDTDLDLAATEAQWRVTECATAGVQYAIEPHVGSICGEVQSARILVRKVERLTLTLDYGHFIMAGENSTQVHELLPFASHIHVRGGGPGRLQTSVAENTIDFPGMLTGLKHLGYAGFLALEYVWIDWNGCNRTDNVSETILLRNALESLASGQRNDE
jgi:sugar phosphate isomerase/epimerase